MIRYSLRCSNSHDFDSWFQSASGFDTLVAAGQLSCPVCGVTDIQKSLMAPNVRPARSAAGTDRDLSAPQTEAETALAALRAQIEANSDYVGMNFANEARLMHEGASDKRSIYGEAKPEDAIALIKDGIPVAPLPFIPQRKTN